MKSIESINLHTLLTVEPEQQHQQQHSKRLRNGKTNFPLIRCNTSKLPEKQKQSSGKLPPTVIAYLLFLILLIEVTSKRFRC